MNSLTIGYGLFTILILALLNLRLFRKKKSKRDEVREGALSDVDAIKGFDVVPSHGIEDGKAEGIKRIGTRSVVEDHSGPGSIEERIIEAQGRRGKGTERVEDRGAEVNSLKSVGRRGETSSRGGREAGQEEKINPFQIMTVFMIGAFATLLNQTLMNVALPHMMNDLNVSANTIQWLVTGYMLVNGVLIPISAFLVQSFSTKKLFITSMLFFAGGSVMSGLAQSFPVLLTGRLIQGVGAGIIMPLMMNVFLTIFPPHQRGKAMGIMGIAMIFAPAAGPTLSGWIVQNYNWRWLFFVALPFALLDLVLAFFWLKDVIKLTKPKLDYLGVITSTLGFGGLLYAFSRAGSVGWGSLEVSGTITVSILIMILFVYWQLHTKHPLLELKVFQYDVFALTNIINALITMAMFGAMVLLPIYLQSIRGFSPIEAGLLLLPGAILMGIMSPIAGALFDRFGARWLAVAGLLVTIFTTWEFTKLTADTSYVHILFLYTTRMFGMSLLMMPVMTEGMNQLPLHLNSHGTAVSNTIRMVSGSLGTALLVTIMTNRTTFHEAAYMNQLTSTDLSRLGEMQTLGASLASQMHLPAQSGSMIAAQMLEGLTARESVIQGINDSFVWATWIAVAAFLLSFFIKRVKVEKKKPVERKVESEFPVLKKMEEKEQGKLLTTEP